MSGSKSSSLLRVVCLLSMGSLAPFARAQETAAALEIRAAAAAYTAALSQGDAAKIAEFWTEDGVYIDGDGHSFPARTLVAKEFAKSDLPPGEKTPAHVESSIHFVGSNVAIEQSPVDQAPAQGTSRFFAAWVKQKDRWRLSLLREFPVGAVGASAEPSSSPLSELTWMVGRWTATQDKAVIELTAEWTEDKSYLLQHFVATQEGEVVRRGTQRIAWDPASNCLRSWTFNTDGSFSEGVWRKEDGVWIVESSGVLADGRRTKAVHFWTQNGNDGCWFKSLRGVVDGQPADEMMLKFSRSRTDVK